MHLCAWCVLHTAGMEASGHGGTKSVCIPFFHAEYAWSWGAGLKSSVSRVQASTCQSICLKGMPRQTATCIHHTQRGAQSIPDIDLCPPHLLLPNPSPLKEEEDCNIPKPFQAASYQSTDLNLRTLIKT